MSSLKCTHTRRKSLFCLACAFGTLLAFLIRSQADAAPARLSLGFGALPWGCGWILCSKAYGCDAEVCPGVGQGSGGGGGSGGNPKINHLV